MLLAVLLACAGTRAVDTPPSPVPAEAVDASAASDAAPPADGGASGSPDGHSVPVEAPPAYDPAALYAQCRERVEGVSSPGECATDTDCARAGCSSEVCVAAGRKAEAVTTCEILPCFEVLSACGCVDGVCAWTVGPPAPRTRVQLPPR